MTTLAEIESQLRSFFRILGAEETDVGLLHEADPFLDAAGEVFRQQIFLTNAQSGDLMCLRPEFTIPVCQTHVANGGDDGLYAYCGKVFRQRGNGDSQAAEFTQAGLEAIGEKDPIRADVMCLERALNALSICGLEALQIVTGDQAVFEALMTALDLPPQWRKKLIREFGDTARLTKSLDALEQGLADPLATLEAPVAEAVRQGDVDAVGVLVEARMFDAGLPTHSGRTPHAIAARMVEKASLASVQLSSIQRQTLNAFLAIDVPVKAVEASLSNFQKAHGIDLGAAAGALVERSNAMVGIGGHDIRYRAAFGRKLDYYTGFAFEVPSANSAKPLVGGGRYDRLLTLLGAKKPVPGIGFSVWADRVVEALDRGGAS